MKKISSYIWKYKWNYVIALFSLFAAVSLDMLSPQLTRRVVDDVIVGGNMGELKYLLLGFFLVGAGRCLFQYLKEYNFDNVGNKISASIRKDLFVHIQKLSADFFDKNNTGELMARIKDDVDHIWDALGFVGMLLIEVTYHTIIIIVCMARINVLLTLVPLLAMICCATIAIVMERKLDKVYGDISEENAVLNTVAEENLAGVRTVKAFAREKFEISKFLSHNKKYYELNMTQSKVFVRYYPYINLITKVVPLLVILCGGVIVINNKMTIGDLTAFLEYSMNICWPLEMLGWLTNSFSSAVASNRKIKKIFIENSSISECEVPINADNIKGDIVFDNVSFHKEDGYMILKNIDFKVEAGKTLGIMGATGAGKTSIVQLLERMYDVTDGAIYVDGTDIRKLSLQGLRSAISFVSQDVFLFSDTIGENIKLGQKLTIDLSDIKRASKAAQAKSFIEKMEGKYDTVIGERGVGLSGGQKQRISIARAFAKKTPILVLDDSTSALDMETEREIEHTLDAMTETTKIIIAHRISAVKNADEIIFLEDGRIAERGTHQSLLERKGLYYQTYLVQTGQAD